MKFLRFACVLLAALSWPAMASTSANGYVIWIAVDQTTTVGYVFSTDGARSTKPACATDNAWNVTGPTTDKAKAIYAAVLTAAASRQQVYVVGTGVCDAAYPTRETVSYIAVYP